MDRMGQAPMCVVCRTRPVDPRWRPFCSERCRNEDLARCADGTIRATDLKQIKAGEDDPGLATYDPAFMNTAACRSRITFIDGDRGILMYRGYPIEQLAESSTYLETAYLILFGELPNAQQLEWWTYQITMHTMVHENIKKFMD